MASSFGSGDPTLQREIRTSHSLTQKLARYRSHQNFLSTCYRNKWCPKGMCLKFAFSALPPSERLHQEIQCIIDRAQRSIVQVCCKYYQRTARHLQHQLTVVKTTLSESMRDSQAEYQTLKGKWRSEEKRLWKSLQEVKKKKKMSSLFSQNRRSPTQTMGSADTAHHTKSFPSCGANRNVRNTASSSSNKCMRTVNAEHISNIQYAQDATPQPQEPGTSERHPPSNKSQNGSQPVKNNPNPKLQQKRNRRFRRPPVPKPGPKQVVNLSSVTLTEDQKYVLSLGPKFCPTPGSYNEMQLLEDIHEGNRRLRLKEFWHDDDAPNQQATKGKFYKKTGWCLPAGRDAALDAYCSLLESKTRNHIPQPTKHQNLRKSHRQAIKELRQLVLDRKIRISPADKGGAIVIQNFDDYIKEAERQLQDKANYAALPSDPSQEIAKTVKLMRPQSERPTFTIYLKYIRTCNNHPEGLLCQGLEGLLRNSRS